MGILFTLEKDLQLAQKRHFKKLARAVGLGGIKRQLFPLKDTLFFYGVHVIIIPNKRKWDSGPFSLSLAPLLGEMIGPFHIFQDSLFIYKKVLLRIHISSQFHQQQSMNRMHLETSEVITAINVFQRCAPVLNENSGDSVMSDSVF